MRVVRVVGQGLGVSCGVLLATVGCSDPVSPTPRGAVDVKFGNAVAGTVSCPATVPSSQVKIGEVGPTQRSTLGDGENGAIVSCRVAKSGSGFLASGSVVQGTSRFFLAPVEVGEGKSNQGSVSVSGANTGGRPYGPDAGEPCTFTVIRAVEGAVWMSFTCAIVSTGLSTAEKCGLYDSYVVVENCGT